MPTESIFFLILAVSALVWSIQLYRKKWLFIWAGLNATSKEQRTRYDMNRLSKILCPFVFFMSLAFFSFIFLPERGMIIVACLMIVFVIITETIVHSPYVKKKESSSGDSHDIYY